MKCSLVDFRKSIDYYCHRERQTGKDRHKKVVEQFAQVYAARLRQARRVGAFHLLFRSEIHDGSQSWLGTQSLPR